MNPVRPDILRLQGYIPGEQPQEAGWVKLNTNENPYPPSPRVVSAIQQAAQGRLNVYPDPLATAFRRRVAELFDLDPDWVLPANGSDENLTILLRTLVDPGEVVCFPYPSYILYETLALLQGGRPQRLLLEADWSWNHERTGSLVEPSKLVLVPNPNSPSGTAWTADDLLRLTPPRGVLTIDEAYADFGTMPSAAEWLKRPEGRRIVVTRTLSKSYALAGIRLGFALAHPDLIAEMRKVKDSYNCDTLSLAAGEAALADQDWLKQTTAKLRVTRERLVRELTQRGFQVAPSQANFVWATHAGGRHREIYEDLKKRRILVRYMSFPDATPDGRTVDGLRITVGTDDQIDALLEALDTVASVATTGTDSA